MVQYFESYFSIVFATRFGPSARISPRHLKHSGFDAWLAFDGVAVFARLFFVEVL
jgi:hypothetical protein